MTLNGKKKSLQSLILVKKKFTNSNAEKNSQIVVLKKKFILKRNPPPPAHPWSVPKSIQKQIIEYNIKSKYPAEYSIVDKAGSEKPLASKSCLA